MTDNVIWSVDFRARREREAAELEYKPEMVDLLHDVDAMPPEKTFNNCAKILAYLNKSDTSPSEMNPQDSA